MSAIAAGWSRRLVDLAAAPSYRRRPQLDAAWLAEATGAAVNEPRYADRARGLASALDDEDGAGTAVEAIEHLLTTTR